MNYTMIVDDLSFVRPQPALYGTENATMRFGEILLEDPRGRCDVVYVCPIIERKNRYLENFDKYCAQKTKEKNFSCFSLGKALSFKVL